MESYASLAMLRGVVMVLLTTMGAAELKFLLSLQRVSKRQKVSDE